MLGFGSSSALAAAYGIAVSSTMVITTMLAYLVARGSWGASRLIAGSLALLFLFIEFGFLAANLTKIADGGWFPLATGALLYIALSTWKQGRALLASRFVERLYPLETFLDNIAAKPPHRVAGAAVFMTSNGDGTPPTLLHNLEHNKILHERVILLTVVTVDGPTVAPERSRDGHAAAPGVLPRPRLLRLHRGSRRAGRARAGRRSRAGRWSRADTTYFLGTETLLATKRPGLPLWRERLFVLMSRNALRATTFFRIPPERVVEIGMQVEL